MKNLLKDEPQSTGQILENIGYSKGVANTPNMVLETDGFKQALAETGLRQALEAQGINPAKIAEKINVLLEAKSGDNDDYTAIDKGLKHATAIYGITDTDKPKSNTGNTYNFIFSEEVQSRIKTVEAEIKSLLTKKHNVQEN